MFTVSRSLSSNVSVVATRNSTTNGYNRNIECLAQLQQPKRRYHERVIDHYEKPRNVGSFDKADPNVGTGLVVSCCTLVAVIEKCSPFFLLLLIEEAKCHANAHVLRIFFFFFCRVLLLVVTL
jgi:hypothetical protein